MVIWQKNNSYPVKPDCCVEFDIYMRVMVSMIILTGFFVFSNHLNSIVFLDNETGYIVGENGTILKNTNGGGPFGIDEYCVSNIIIYNVSQPHQQ